MEMDLLTKYVQVGSTQQGEKYIKGLETAATYEKDVTDISKREFEELLKKFSQNNTVPNFDLDLTKAKDGKYFEEKMLAAVPKGTK
jgi:hypothetical protein